MSDSCEIDGILLSLEKSLSLLSSRDGAEQREAVGLLKAAIVRLLERVSVAQGLDKILHDLNRRIYELLSDDKSETRLGAVLAIEVLVELLPTNDVQLPNQSRYATYLRSLLPTHDAQIAAATSRTLAKLALCDPLFSAEIVDFELPRSIDWIRAGKSYKEVMCGLSLLSALVRSLPSLSTAYFSSIVQYIWPVLNDPEEDVFSLGVSVLIAILKTVGARKGFAELADYTQRTASEVDMLFERGLFRRAGFIIKSLILNELCDDFLLSLLPSFARKLMCHAEDADLIPLVLKCGQGLEWFSALLSDWMSYLLRTDSLSSEFSLSALAATLRLVKTDQRYYDSINAYLIQTYTPASFYYECVSSAADALQEKLDCKQFAPLMLRRDLCLTESFAHAIAAMCRCGVHAQSLYIERALIGGLCGSISVDSERTNLLGILACVDFDPRNGLLFGPLGEALACWFSDSTDASTRSLAGTIYLSLIARSASQGVCVPKCSSALQLVVRKLAQEDSELVRTKLFGWFECNASLDQLLARSPLAVSAIAAAVNHSHLGTRLSAYAVLRRLSFLNPSSVLPRFHRLLVQCLADLCNNTTKHLCMDGASALAQLLAFPSKFLLPYTSTILAVVVKCLPTSRPPLTTHLVMAVGKIAEIDDAGLLPHFPDIVRIATGCVQDATSAELRLASLQSLCSVARFVNRESLPRSIFARLWHQASEALRAEQEPGVRNEIIKLLGCIGAIDPYKIQAASFERALVDTQTDAFRGTQSSRSNADEGLSELSEASSDDVSSIATLCGGLSSPECISTVAMHQLLKILGDPALSSLHIAAVETIVELLQCTGARPARYIGQVFQSLLAMLKQALKLPSLFDFYTVQVSKILLIVRNYGRAFVPDMLRFFLSFPWVASGYPAALLIPISSLNAIFIFIRSAVVSLKAEAHSLVFDTMPTFLHAVEILSTEAGAKLNADDALLTAVQIIFSLGPMLLEYSHLVVRIVCAIVQGFAVGCGPVSRQAHGLLCFTIKALPSLNLDLDFSSGMPTLVPHIVGVAERFPDFHQLCHDAIRSLAFSHAQRDLGIIKSLVSASSGTVSFEEAFISQPTNSIAASRTLEEEGASQDAQKNSSLFNPAGLRSSWNNAACNSKDEWFEWIKAFGLSLVRDSPSATVRVLGKLASLHYPMARDLFNLAFAVAFDSIKESEQEELVAAIENAFAASSTPLDVIQQLLNLAEFLEHEERPLPIDIHTLGAYAYKCHAFAKALYYKELEYKADASTNIVESLISINHQMQQSDAAAGLLAHAQNTHGLALKESWYEKLNRWDEALKEYERKLEEEPGSYEPLLGVFRCRNALGHWQKLTQMANEFWPTLGDSIKAAIAPLAAASAWAILDWESMGNFVAAVSPAVPDGAFFRAVMAARDGDSALAFKLIGRTRELIDAELTALLSESYARAYKTVVRVQAVSELEEAIFYLSAPYESPHRRRVERTWNLRLQQCQQSVEVWQRILKLHALAISPRTSHDLTASFAKLCQRSGRTILARECYCFLLNLKEDGIDEMDMNAHNPTITYSLIKHLWACGEEDRAVAMLRRLIGCLSKAPDSSSSLARCHYRMGLWLKHRTPEMDATILDHFQAASSFDRKWYKAWHGLAMASQEMIASFELHRGTEARPRSNPYVVPSIQSFFKSIGLAKPGGTLQDTLRLLTLWFKFGNLPEVNAAISDGFYSIPIENWLTVVPQLIARIHVPNPQVRRLIHHVLTDIGRQHPQALVMQITVASKSPSMSRRTAALALLDKLRSHSSMLVDQAATVSQELIRVAILWEEMWHDGLEEASRLYFGDHDVGAMLSILDPLHQMISREQQFLAVFGSELKQAHELCQRYKRIGDSKDLNSAWELYYRVSRRINKQLPLLNGVDLECASPRLFRCRHLELAVPGMHDAASGIVKVQLFQPHLAVIASKQRPRRLAIVGSDGLAYRFLLKGHEDLRQDQRVMQFFGLVNTLLETSSETTKRHLSIRTFSVIPLSQNTGLISWLPHCDTMHALVKDFRESRGMLLSLEHRLMLQFAPDYDRLALLQKVEAFKHAMDKTEGDDLAKVFWQKSKSSEVWFERRVSYVRTLAVMSISGYILGLGDRHPSNLLIDRVTGQVVHIDFGDCFEVAMQRERFPEKVPFRLTRMLVNALEVLRSNKDSLMALLEAFVRANLQVLPIVRDLDLLFAATNESDGRAEESFPAEFSAGRRVRREEEIAQLEEDSLNRPDALNAGALNVISRVSNKLTGREFPGCTLDVSSQVSRLILEATSEENLCQAYVGWCPFW